MMASYIRIKYPKDMSLVDLATLHSQVAQADAENTKRMKVVQEQFRQLLHLAHDLYGPDSNEYKYLKRAGFASAPNLWKEFNKFERRYLDWRWEEEQRQRRNEQSRKRYASAKAAEKALLENGYVLYEHFQPGADARRFAAQVLVEIAPGKYGPRMLPAKVGSGE